MSKEPNRNVYVGHRYVPKVMGEWKKQNDYEGLSIVTHQGASYTSKKRVPVGIDILNEEFWVLTGNYNAQVEYYRDDVNSYRDEVVTYKEDTDTQIQQYKGDTDTQIQQYKNDTDNQIQQYKGETDNQIQQYKGDTDSQILQYKGDMENYTDNQIQNVNNVIESHKDDNDDNFERIVNRNNSEFINAKYPPSPLIGIQADGETNDTDNLQTILDYCVDNNYNLKLPTGLILVTPDVLTIKGSILIEGSNNSVLITKHKERYIGMLKTVTTGISNVTIRNVVFDQRFELGHIEFGATADGVPTKHLYAYNVQDFLLEQCTFYGIGRGCLSTSGGVNFIRDNFFYFIRANDYHFDSSMVYLHDDYHEFSRNVLDSIKNKDVANTTSYCSGGIETHSNHSFVADNTIQHCSAGINITPRDYRLSDYAKTRLITNNVIRDCNSGVVIYPNPSDENGLQNIQISNNAIAIHSTPNSIGTAGISFNRGQAMAGITRNLSIKNNIIHHAGNVDDFEDLATDIFYFGGILINPRYGAQGVTISNNQISNFPMTGIGLLSESGTNKDVSVYDNDLINCGWWSGTLNEALNNVFLVSNTDGVKIKRNRIKFQDSDKYTHNRQTVLIYLYGTGIKNMDFENNEVLHNSDFLTLKLYFANSLDKSTINIDTITGKFAGFSKPDFEYYASTEQPTTGTYINKDILLYVGDDPAEGLRGFRVARTGTKGVSNAVIRVIDSTTFEIVSGDIKVGETFNIPDVANGTRMVDWKKGSIISADNPMAITGDNVELSYVNPLFLELK